MKKMLIMGPPGAGKGTQAENIVKYYNIPHISTGDMFRVAMDEKTELGLLAKSYIDKGELVPDEVTIGIVRDRLLEPDCKKGFLLDGFPRNLVQAKKFAEVLTALGEDIDVVLNINVDFEKLINRIIGRRICPICAKTYHISYNKPKKQGVCDECFSDLIKRKDDTKETVTKRLEVYTEQTEPLIEYYKDKIIMINGDQEVDSVFAEIKETIGDII